jgi:selenocysteine lyase/cysteine desulfurase
MGEPSDFASMPVAVASIEALLGWGGPAAVAAYAGALGERVAAGAARLGLEVAPAGLRAGHLLGLRLPGGSDPALADRLAAEQVHVSLRGDALRVSPNVYNSESDVDRLLDVLAVGV